MAVVVPTSFVTTRALTLAGTAYAKGATVPPLVIAHMKNASALLSRRWIVPNADPHHRRGAKPKAIGMSAAMRKAIIKAQP